jgi:hypothetical protein
VLCCRLPSYERKIDGCLLPQTRPWGAEFDSPCTSFRTAAWDINASKQGGEEVQICVRLKEGDEFFFLYKRRRAGPLLGASDPGLYRDYLLVEIPVPFTALQVDRGRTCLPEGRA